MLTFPPSVRIYAARRAVQQPVDMRKSHHGLAAIVREQLDLDPLSGHLVLFTNKRGNLLKILFFDRSGLALLYQRLEQRSFQLPTVDDDDASVEIDPGQLAVILEGIDLRSAVRRKRYKRPPKAPVSLLRFDDHYRRWRFLVASERAFIHACPPPNRPPPPSCWA